LAGHIHKENRILGLAFLNPAIIEYSADARTNGSLAMPSPALDLDALSASVTPTTKVNSPEAGIVPQDSKSWYPQAGIRR